jgi:pyridoxal/pyridoxine/pyridoxamine kinase
MDRERLDLFAAAALTGLLAGRSSVTNLEKVAFEIAEKMLEQSERAEREVRWRKEREARETSAPDPNRLV